MGNVSYFVYKSNNIHKLFKKDKNGEFKLILEKSKIRAL